MSRVAPYSALARIYDAVSGREGFGVYRPVYEGLIDRLDLRPALALDAACGTGLWAARLARRGWTVVGIDRSAEMLRKARRRCAGLRVSLVEKELAEIDDRGRFRLVTCTYDALNYMTAPRELEKVLRRFAASLAPRGVAIFDLNTTVALRDLWGTQSVVRRAGRVVSVWTTRWDPATLCNTLTMEHFVPERGDADRFERVVEVHVERAYEPQEVTRLALRAGFRSVEAFDGRSGLAEVTPRSGKVVYVARP